MQPHAVPLSSSPPPQARAPGEQLVLGGFQQLRVPPGLCIPQGPRPWLWEAQPCALSLGVGWCGQRGGGWRGQGGPPAGRGLRRGCPPPQRMPHYSGPGWGRRPLFSRGATGSHTAAAAGLCGSRWPVGRATGAFCRSADGAVPTHAGERGEAF